MERIVKKWIEGSRTRETLEDIVSEYNPYSEECVDLIGQIAGLDAPEAENFDTVAYQRWFDQTVGEDGIVTADDGSVLVWGEKIPVPGEGRSTRSLAIRGRETV